MISCFNISCGINYRPYFSSKQLINLLRVQTFNGNINSKCNIKECDSEESKISVLWNYSCSKYLLDDKNYSTCQRSFGLANSGYRFYSTIKKHINYSNVPTLHDDDLEEQFVKGSGPGGQKINKTSSCVVLKHIPTGLIVKCQETRSLDQNRKKARTLLTTKLDNFLNGESSVEGQTKKLLEKKKNAYENKKEKMRALKEAWKQSENIP